MDAMILAAGLGTRLRPFTDEVPKALVTVGDRTLLEHVAGRLIAAGADRLIVNVHHHADRMLGFLEAWDPGVEVRVSREEPEVLETGGGLEHARSHFREGAPFFLHNVDVLTTADLSAMYAAHRAGAALATLAVGDRETDRRLLFDDRGLYGRRHADGSVDQVRDVVGTSRAVGFDGIHVIDPRIFDRLDRPGRFPIVEVYLNLAAEGERILAWDVGEAFWIDVGTPERLKRARAIEAEAPKPGRD